MICYGQVNVNVVQTLCLWCCQSLVLSTYGKEEEKEKEGIWEWARGMGLTRGWEI